MVKRIFFIFNDVRYKSKRGNAFEHKQAHCIHVQLGISYKVRVILGITLYGTGHISNLNLRQIFPCQ